MNLYSTLVKLVCTMQMVKIAQKAAAKLVDKLILLSSCIVQYGYT